MIEWNYIPKEFCDRCRGILIKKLKGVLLALLSLACIGTAFGFAGCMQSQNNSSDSSSIYEDKSSLEEDENASQGLKFSLNVDFKSYSVTGIGTCTDTEIVIPAYYKGLPITKIGAMSFEDFEAITSVVIGNNVVVIENGAFGGCKNLVSVEIGDNVERIDGLAFEYCEAITSVVIGDSVTTIGDRAFAYCDSLTSITFEGTIAEWKKISKGDYWNESVPATEVVCSDGTVAL